MICHRVAILNKGRLMKVGRTEELLVSRDRYEVVARGIASGRVSTIRNFEMGSVVFTVPATSQREALERVWALGGEVLSVNPVRRTLEEVFVAVDQGNGADMMAIWLIARKFPARKPLAGPDSLCLDYLYCGGCSEASAGSACRRRRRGVLSCSSRRSISAYSVHSWRPMQFTTNASRGVFCWCCRRRSAGANTCWQ